MLKISIPDENSITPMKQELPDDSSDNTKLASFSGFSGDVIKTETEIKLEIESHPLTVEVKVSDATAIANVLNCPKQTSQEKRKSTKPKNALDMNTPHPPASEEPFHCEVCNKTFKNNVDFALHSIQHSQDNKYKCHLCNRRIFTRYAIKMHIKVHEGTTNHNCEICGKACSSSIQAIEHKNFHTGEKPFQCEICGKSFSFSAVLSSHRTNMHCEIITGRPLVKYDCAVCKKHYASASGLKRHNLKNHDASGIDESVLCDICGKRIASKEKLNHHQRIHTGYKPFSCKTCSKSFSAKKQLKEHERVHTGERPYICRHCGKGFTQRTTLSVHERTHTGERPYICKICGKGFITKGAVDTHMKTCSSPSH